MDGLISPKPIWKMQSKYTKRVRWNLITPIAYILLGLIAGNHWGSRISSTYNQPFQANIVQTFELHEIFTEVPSIETNEAWNELIPLGRGFIGVNENEEPILYSGIDILDLSRVRSVSLFHQIHCLNELRLGYYSNLNASNTSMNMNIPSDDTNSEASSSSSSLLSEGNSSILERRRPKHDHGENHMKHCFDYLRQAITCAADMSLEHLHESSGSIFPGVDGWGSKHQCRDYNEVSEWAIRYRASGGEGIQ